MNYICMFIFFKLKQQVFKAFFFLKWPIKINKNLFFLCLNEIEVDRLHEIHEKKIEMNEEKKTDSNSSKQATN